MDEAPEITITSLPDDASVVSVMVSEDVAYPAMEVRPADCALMASALRTLANELDRKPVMH